MLARHGAAAQACKADCTHRAFPGDAVPTALAVAFERDAAPSGRCFAQQQGGARRRVHFHAVVRFDDLYVPILAKAGRRLPKRVREAAGYLADAVEMAQNPKLLVRVDESVVAEAFDVCVRHLGAADRAERRKGMLVGMAASAAFSVLMVAVLVLGFLYWRGMI